MWLVKGLLMGRARVEVREDALVVHPGISRARVMAWQDVEALTLDPPGGPRLLRLNHAKARVITLPELSDEDTATVLAIYEKHRTNPTP